MKLIKSIKKAALLALLLSASIANASVYHFDLSGAYTASWDLDSTPTPLASYSGMSFFLLDIAGSFPGAVSAQHDLTVYNAADAGGLAIDEISSAGLVIAVATDGPQLYTGTEDNPVFKLGTFAMTDFSNPSLTYTLVISDGLAAPGAAVPEPASLALFGVGLIGLNRARRRRSAGSASPATTV